jgi:hypothetical protein
MLELQVKAYEKENRLPEGLASIGKTEENICALVSTPDTVRLIPPNKFRARDGFWYWQVRV